MIIIPTTLCSPSELGAKGILRASTLPLQTPHSKYPLFSGYDVDPLLKKEVFTLENQVSQNIPYKKWVFGVGGSMCGRLP